MTGNQKIRTLIYYIQFGFEETTGKIRLFLKDGRLSSYIQLGFEETTGKSKVIFKGWEIERHIWVGKDVSTCS